MLGGASLLLWLLMAVGSRFRGVYGVGQHFADIVATTATLNVLINYPHFLASYHLAYGRGWAFVIRHWFQTLAVPAAMVVVFGWTAVLLAGSPANQSLAAVVLGGMVNLMFLTAGWHYVKQAFGVMMVYANYDKYPLTRLQRDLIRYSLLALWWHTFVWSGRYGDGGELMGLKYSSWHLLLPRWAVPLTGLLLLGLVLAMVWHVLASNWRRGARPGLNFLTPYLAMFVWFAPWLRQTEYFLYAVPFFHSLQYLGFVFRVERSRADRLRRSRELTGAFIVIALIVVGWLAFELIPGRLDALLVRRTTIELFVLAAAVFINVHHFFLDNVLWRIGKDPEVREALLS